MSYFTLLFCAKNLTLGMYFAVTTHLNSDKPHFMYLSSHIWVVTTLLGQHTIRLFTQRHIMGSSVPR